MAVTCIIYNYKYFNKFVLFLRKAAVGS